MKLSIIIPVYNEEKTILEIIKKVRALIIPSVTKEVVIVDDGSTDSTRKKLREVKGMRIILHNKNRGKY